MEMMNLPSLLFIHRLERRTNQRKKIVKMLQAHNIAIIICSFLDTRSIIHLTQVDRKCHNIINIAVIQIRLLKEKIDTIQGIPRQSNKKAQQSEMVMAIQPDYRPIKLNMVKKEGIVKKEIVKKHQKKEGQMQPKKARPQIQLPKYSQQQILDAQLKRQRMLDQIQRSFLEQIETQWQEHPEPLTIIDHMLDYADPTGFERQSTWKQKTAEDIKRMAKWARRKAGILFFRDPNY